MSKIQIPATSVLTLSEVLEEIFGRPGGQIIKIWKAIEVAPPGSAPAQSYITRSRHISYDEAKANCLHGLDPRPGYVIRDYSGMRCNSLDDCIPGEDVVFQ